MKRHLVIFIIILLVFKVNFSGYAQELNTTDSQAMHWADSVIGTLSLNEMIGQLIIVRANHPNEKYLPEVGKYIQDFGIGGVTFFGGSPYRQALQTNIWQKASKTPLLVCIDAEWGLGMRLDSAFSFPYQMTLGAIQENSSLMEMGKQVAMQCKRMAIQMNFAPVVDINSNPSNPVIHMRSFGQDKYRVTAKSKAYMEGMMSECLLVAAKHFPGHGDTDTDSHHTLPVIRHDKERLDSTELFPYRMLIENGLNGIMTAHLHIPLLDSSLNTPATLSAIIVSDLLRDEMQFSGLAITDALDMKGITNHFCPGQIEVKAIQAGNDLLLLSTNIPAVIDSIRTAIQNGHLSENTIREKCHKVLTYKYMAGLNNPTVIELRNLLDDLNPVESKVLKRQLFEEAVTLVKNEAGLIPLTRLDTLQLASVSIGLGRETPFQERLKYYSSIDNYWLEGKPTKETASNLINKLKIYNLVIVSVQNTGIWTRNNFNISETAIEFIRQLQSEKKIILDIFASPYALSLFEELTGAGAIVISYQDDPVMQEVSAQAIFGGVPIRGRLPVDGSPEFPIGTGMDTESTRLKYTIPEAAGIHSKHLYPIDSIVNECIEERVFPGCQVMAIKDGQVFFLKSFGYHTYDKKLPVDDFDLYDLASLTKAAASTSALMKLKEEGRIDIDQMLIHYLHYLQGTDKATIIIRNMMAHQARLKPWIPFYISLVEEGKPDPDVFQPEISEDFPVRVAENLYIRKGYERVIMDSIIFSQLLKTSDYKYSDLGYYFLKEIIGNVTNKELNDYVWKKFYKPLGMSSTGFLPRKSFNLERIVPTEYDRVFRQQLLHGDVHDQGAAMLGGVAGHAGLFSNANDMGIFLQMLLNEGAYGGITYFQPETVHEFTQLQSPLNENRRGIGFDKPLIEFEEDGPTCEGASKLSFGHSGFTGTYMWADPANGLIYVFLSNRVHPDSGNNKISEWNIRTKIHQFFYDAIEKSKIFAP
jgi:beta-glucosidase-like glycosyl hydrolase/CubicO group peptidase (beta-lactamase class C family)